MKATGEMHSRITRFGARKAGFEVENVHVKYR